MTTTASDFDEFVFDELSAEPLLSAAVARSLALVLDAAGVSRNELLALLPVIPALASPDDMVPDDDSTGDADERTLGSVSPRRERCGRVIRATEAVQAFAAAVQLDAIEDLFDDLTADPPAMVATGKNYAKRLETWRGQCRDAVLKETAMLTGGMTGECRSKVKVATTPGDRHTTSRKALRAGATTWSRVRTVATQTTDIDPATAQRIAERVLAPSHSRVLDLRKFTHTSDGGDASAPESNSTTPTDENPTNETPGDDSPRIDPPAAAATPTESGGSHDLLPVSHDGFRARLNRQLAIAQDNADVGKKKRADRLAARDTRVEMLDHGTAEFAATGSVERVCAAQQRVDHLARAARAGGDKRTLAQLRSDIATDLLIHGVVPGDKELGEAPAARLEILVGLDTLLGGPYGAASHGETRDPSAQQAWTPQGRTPEGWTPEGWIPDEIGCGETAFGPIPASICRELLFTEGTLIRRLITDPATGQVIDAASTYRVPASMAAFVQARDRYSRAPGVEARRTGTDFDHCTNWSESARTPGEGQTHPDNLRVLDRGHHNLKTRGYWSSSQAPDGTVTWKTLTAVIDTRPFDANDATWTPVDLPDPSIKEATKTLEDQLGVDPVTAAQAALIIAALGGPVPAAPSRQVLAEQDAADQVEIAQLWELNLKHAQRGEARQAESDAAISAQREALLRTWHEQCRDENAKYRDNVARARAAAEAAAHTTWHEARGFATTTPGSSGDAREVAPRLSATEPSATERSATALSAEDQADLERRVAAAGDEAAATIQQITPSRPTLPPYVRLDWDFTGPQWADARPGDAGLEPPF